MDATASLDETRTLFDLAPHAMEQNVILGLSNLHMDCLSTFLMPKPHHPGQFESLGTGFFVYWPETPDIVRLVTAAHVIENFDFEYGRITVGNMRIALGNVGQKNPDKIRDTLVWSIPSSHFIRRNITNVPTLPFWEPDLAKTNLIPTQSFMIMGYPASKNKALDFRYGKEPSRNVTAMAIHVPPMLSEQGVLQFAYSGKGVNEAWAGGSRTSPYLKGMSGSPCLRIISDRATGKIGVVLAGVFTEWDKSGHYLSVGWFGDPWLVPTSPQ